MYINKLNTFVNGWNFDKMSFMVDLRIDIRTKEMLSTTPCKKCISPTLLVLPFPAGPAGHCPLNFLNLIKLKFRVRARDVFIV